MKHHSRLIPPVLLIIFGLWLLHGCIYIPTFGTKVSGENAAKQVGDAKSRRPLRVGHATRDDVLKLLGEPYVASADGSAMAYGWTVRNGIAFWPLCFYANSVLGERTLVLRFDERGVLRHYEVLKADEGLIEFHGVGPPLPADLQEVEHQRAHPGTPMPRPGSSGTSGGSPPPPPGPTYETTPTTSP